MNSDARRVYRRSKAAYVAWCALTGVLAAVGVAMMIQGLSGLTKGAVMAFVAGPAAIWIAAWVWMCARVVWTYRRQIPTLMSSDDPFDQTMAQRYADVAMRFTLRDLSGVHLDGVTRTPLARFVDGQWPLVGHVAAIGLVIIAASLE